MRNKDADHIIVIVHHHEASNSEEEPGDTHPGIDDGSWGFILQVHFFFVVDTFGGLFEYHGVEGTFPSELVEPLRLICPLELRSVAGEVAIVEMGGGSALKPVHVIN